MFSALHADEDSMIESMQDRANKMSEVANYRDAIYAASEDKMFKVIVGGVIGAWMIYHFLIKR